MPLTPAQFVQGMKAAADEGLREYDAEQALKIKPARYKLGPFLSYYGDSNVTDCYQSAWFKVCNALGSGWTSRHVFMTSEDAAAAEIKRLQDAERLAKQLENDLREARANASRWEDATEEAHANLDRLVDALKREQSEVTNLRVMLADAKARATPPVLGGGYQAHTQSVRRAATRWRQFPGRRAELGVAEAVHFLLQRVEKLEEQNAALSAKVQVYAPPPPCDQAAQNACGQTRYQVQDAQTGQTNEKALREAMNIQYRHPESDLWDKP